MFEIYKTESSGEFRFRLKAKNGQNILASEGYKAKSGAKNGIESVKKNATDPEKYRRKESESGKHSFSLLSGNNQVIGTSQSYTTASGMENGIQSVMSNAPDAEVKDLTVKD